MISWFFIVVHGCPLSFNGFSKNWISKNWISKNWISRNWISKNWISRNCISRNLVPEIWYLKFGTWTFGIVPCYFAPLGLAISIHWDWVFPIVYCSGYSEYSEYSGYSAYLSLTWVVTNLELKGIERKCAELKGIERNWTELSGSKLNLRNQPELTRIKRNRAELSGAGPTPKLAFAGLNVLMCSLPAQPLHTHPERVPQRGARGRRPCASLCGGGRRPCASLWVGVQGQSKLQAHLTHY